MAEVPAYAIKMDSEELYDAVFDDPDKRRANQMTNFLRSRHDQIIGVLDDGTAQFILFAQEHCRDEAYEYLKYHTEFKHIKKVKEVAWVEDKFLRRMQ